MVRRLDFNQPENPVSVILYASLQIETEITMDVQINCISGWARNHKFIVTVKSSERTKGFEIGFFLAVNVTILGYRQFIKCYRTK